MPDPHPPSTLRAARALTLRLRKLRGGVLVGEALRRLYGRAPRLVRVTDFDGSLTLDLDLSEHMQSQIFWFGFYSGEVAAVLKGSLRPGDTFIDCGANIGELALLGSKLVGPEGRVFAFEPLSELADQLERHAAINQAHNLEVIRTGVFSKSGAAPLFKAGALFADGTEHRGLGTLFSTPERGVEAASIPLISLDDFVDQRQLEAVRMIKLDIEGAELAALEGARQAIKRFRPLLIVEIGRETCQSAGYEPGDIFSFIAGLGYRIHRIGSRGRLWPIEIGDLRDFQNVYCAPDSGSDPGKARS